MAPVDDAFDRLLAAARDGEEWALTRLYRDHHPGLLRYLRAREPGEAEDLASEVWIQVAQVLPRFSGSDDDFRRLLFTIGRRRAIDWGRKRGRRRSDPADAAAFANIGAPADIEAAVVDQLTADEAVRRITAMLPADQADVILLRVLGGLSVAEVAEVMGKRPGAISVLQHRALRRLARRLGDRDLV